MEKALKRLLSSGENARSKLVVVEDTWLLFAASGAIFFTQSRCGFAADVVIVSAVVVAR